ncbi:MAG: hypothetical protein AVDCRST_MAG04-423, partial [uncultured Acetobacteraceae bacterium]
GRMAGTGRSGQDHHHRRRELRRTVSGWTSAAAPRGRPI